MPLNQLFYPYDTNWKPEPIYGGWLAGERDNEAGLARLMQMYDAAQQMQKQQQEFRHREQMNPLDVQGKGLANTTTQQALDINAPKAAKALAQVSDPTWLPGEMKSDRIKGEAEDTENLAKTQAGKRARVMSLFEKWAAGNVSPLEIQFDIEQFDPSERQMLLQASKDPSAALEIMLDQDAQKSWSKDKVKETQKNLTSLEIANIGAQSRIAAANAPRAGSNRPLSPEQRYVKYLDDLLETGQIDQNEFDRLWADFFNKKYGPKVQPGMMLAPGTEGGTTLTTKPQPAITPPARKGAPEEKPKLSPEERKRIIEELQKRNQGK